MENNKILYRSKFILFDDHQHVIMSINELDFNTYNTIAVYTWYSLSNKIYYYHNKQPSADLLEYLESIGINKSSVIKS